MWANFISHGDEGAIFHNFRKEIISHSASPNISLEAITDLCYNEIVKGGGFMKKFFSLVFFILTIAVFIFELYISIAGAIDVNNQLVELAARGAGGHELLGVGLDILVFGLVFISVVGFVISYISWRIAQNRVIRIVSAMTYPMFVLPIFVCAIILIL